MNNRYRAYHALERGLGHHPAEYAEHVLAQAGLLAPDLPGPKIGPDGAKAWKGGEIWVEDDEDAIYASLPSFSRWTAAEAREVAYALLAAADYSEGIIK